MSHVECAPLAFEAACEAADTVLAALIPGIRAHPDRLSQHERCNELFAEEQRCLIPTLSKPEQYLLAENASPLGRKWLNAIPSCATFALSDMDVQAGLHYTTLLPTTAERCHRCNAPSYRGHAESCHGRPQTTVARHETIKHIMAEGLGTISEAVIKVEPYIIGTARRNDISVTLAGDRRYSPAEQ